MWLPFLCWWLLRLMCHSPVEPSMWVCAASRRHLVGWRCTGLLSIGRGLVPFRGKPASVVSWHVLWPHRICCRCPDGHCGLGGLCQNLVLKGKILSKRSGKSVDKFRGSEWSAPKSNPSGSGKPIVEGVGPNVMITMDFGISPGCYQVEGVKTLNYSGNSVVK